MHKLQSKKLSPIHIHVLCEYEFPNFLIYHALNIHVICEFPEWEAAAAGGGYGYSDISCKFLSGTYDMLF